MSSLTRVGLAGVAIAAVVGGVLWTTASDGSPAEEPTTAPVELATDTVTRRTLRHTEEFDGSLGYGDQFPLPGAVVGTVSWVPEEGAVLQPGDMLYKVDEKPTFWARGDVPMYRSLDSQSEGTDVEQLQRFLQEEGHLDAEAKIDGNFGNATRRAVKAWQKEHDLKETGRIDATQLLFLPYDSVRVAATPRVGEAATGGVLEVTEPDLFVTATVNGRKKRVFEGDPNIEIVTANGTRYPATVESIEAQQSQDPFGGQEYGVRLQLAEASGQEPGEVEVHVIDVLAADALTVPARALVALVEGGYALEVVRPDGPTTYVAVEIGEFADGWVEVTGDIAEGDQVAVPE